MSEDLGKVRLHTNLRFIREIAAGAMGTVFEAEDSGAEGFTKRVAVKRLHPGTQQEAAVCGDVYPGSQAGRGLGA